MTEYQEEVENNSAGLVVFFVLVFFMAVMLGSCAYLGRKSADSPEGAAQKERQLRSYKVRQCVKQAGGDKVNYTVDPEIDRLARAMVLLQCEELHK